MFSSSAAAELFAAADAGYFITLDGNLKDSSGFNHLQKVTVIYGGASSGRLFENLKQHHHHEADHQPEGQVLIKRIQCDTTSMERVLGLPVDNCVPTIR